VKIARLSNLVGLDLGRVSFPLQSSYYPAEATLVCLLSDISSAVPLFLSGTDISATVTPIGVKLCLLVELCTVF